MINGRKNKRKNQENIDMGDTQISRCVGFVAVESKKVVKRCCNMRLGLFLFYCMASISSPFSNPTQREREREREQREILSLFFFCLKQRHEEVLSKIKSFLKIPSFQQMPIFISL